MIIPVSKCVSVWALAALFTLLPTFQDLQAQAPLNDNFADAPAIEGANALVFNDLALAEPDEPAHGGIPASRSLWWTYSSPGYANVFVDAASSAFDPVVAVYTGDSLTGLTVAPGRYAGPTGNPRAAYLFVAEPGKTYRVAVDILFGSPGRVGLQWSADPFEPLLPEIVTQPGGARIALGGAAAFRVVAKGTPAVSYRWWRGDQPVVRGTNATLEFRNTTVAEAGSYTVVVSNLLGSVRSEAAALEVVLTPIITKEPVAETVAPRGTATFTVTASGGTSAGYQWLRDGVPVSNGNKFSLTVANVQEGDVGLYSVRVANFYGVQSSAEVPLTLSRPATPEELLPEIISVEGMPTVQEGSPVDYLARTAGAKPQSFQWYRNGVPVPGATNPAFSWVATPDLAGAYSVVMSNAIGSVTNHLVPTVVTSLVRPENDDFANRKPLPFEPVIAGSNFRATRELDEPIAGPTSAGRSVWWTFRVPQDSMVTFLSQDTSFYPILSVYSGDELTALQLVARGANTSSNGASTVTFHGYAGDLVNLSVEDYYGGGGSIRLRFQIVADPPKDQPPEIIQPPVGAVSLDAGSTLTLQVEATGAYPLSYEWRQGDQLIRNAVGAVLTVTNAQPSDSGSYTVSVINAKGRVTSSPAAVTVNGVAAQFAAALPVITVTAGYPTALTPRVTGSTPFQFQWTFEGRPLPGATNPALRWVPTRPGGPLAIGLTVENPVGTTSPTPAQVTVVPAGVRYRWTTLAGVANQAGAADGIGSSARFSSPSGITLDAQGTLYVADAGSGMVRRVTPEGEVTTVVGPGSVPLRFGFPVDVAVDREGALLVLNQGAVHRLFGEGLVGTLGGGDWGIGVASDGSLWRTVNADRIQRIAADGSLKLVASNLQTPVDVTLDAAGNAYIAEANGPTIRRLAVDGQLTIFAGVSGKYGSTDGPAATAQFQHPNSVCFDGAGNLFVADEFANSIRRISPDGTVTTVGGAFLRYGSADGVGAEARFSSPRRVVATHGGTLYVVDTGAHTLRKGVPIDPALPVLQARTVDGRVQVSWTPGDGLVWLEAADRPDATTWVPVDPLSDRNNSQHTLPEADTGQTGFFRLRAQ